MTWCRVHTHRGTRGRNGTEWFSIRAIFGRLGFYQRVIDQKWSPFLTERNKEYGIQIAHVRVAFSRNYLIWHDEQSPRVERRFW